MSKTPEELAEEYCEDHDECEFARDAFLAGYKAAVDLTETRRLEAEEMMRKSVQRWQERVSNWFYPEDK